MNAGNDGGWQIELNTQTLPKVLINHEYYAEIKDLGLEKSEFDLVRDQSQRPF